MRCIGLLFVASAITACAPEEPTQSETPKEALTASDAVARAEQWVAAQLQYCQAANHQPDLDPECSTICNREDNPAWDPYRSDCSGLVSWAWGLAAPGLVTSQFSGITSVIDASSLRAGDAVKRTRDDVHIMLFVGWITQGTRATFIEEPGCATAITHAHQFDSDVSISGSSIYVSYEGDSFTAIRYNSFGGGGGGSCVVGGSYCGGDKLSGDPNTLYRCTGGTPTVLSHCANGCAIIPGQDDVCSTSSGGGCVAGGLYCGGDKVSGNASTLYRCNGTAAPSVVEQCGNGCSVNAGTDDSCNSGGSCVVGGLYCGGDKVSGNTGTLYRCTGGSSGTVVTQCAAGCVVFSGRDDACK